ncbi:MAG: TfoX/Sxy family DNA transformation protein [Saccharospirillaceae bacterium]|nr:TfoX/Sxy family protein [Pseudomonadales bacterium]NRB80180.1 TfoX/Sxy family DNA transformation protein [Saccharospirillaceae bacterium]
MYGYPKTPKHIRDLNSFGPKCEEIFAKVDIHTVQDFMNIEPFELYQKSLTIKGVGLNLMYAILGARENISWLEIKNTRKLEILLRLDDMGIAPK